MQKQMGRICMVGAAVLWGLAGVCVKSISWSALSIVTARSLISFLMIVIAKRSFRLRFTKQNIWGALMMSFTGILYIQAIKLTTAGTAIVLQYIAPILVFLFAVLFQHRKPKGYEILCTFAVFAGIILSFADSLDPTSLLGDLLGLASGITFAGQIIIMNHGETDSQDSMAMSCLFSLLVTLPFALMDSSLVFTPKNILWILILSIFQYGLANLLFGYGVQRVDKIEGSLLLTIEPIFNPIPVAILCGEQMGPLALTGAVIVIVFVTLYGLIPALQERKGTKV